MTCVSMFQDLEQPWEGGRPGRETFSRLRVLLRHMPWRRSQVAVQRRHPPLLGGTPAFRVATGVLQTAAGTRRPST